MAVDLNSKPQYLACLTELIALFLDYFVIMDHPSALCDITNIPKKKVYKRLSDGTRKQYEVSTKIRKNIDCYFDSEAGKLHFDKKCQEAKTKTGLKTNSDLFLFLLDNYMECVTSTGQSNKTSCFTLCDSESDDVFLCSKKQLYQLCDKLVQVNFDNAEYRKQGQVASLTLSDYQNGCFVWSSSVSLSSNFELNYKSIHAYLSSGMLPTQYEKFCQFLGIGTSSNYFRDKAIGFYGTATNAVFDQCIASAIEEEKELTDRPDDKVAILTDARHGCRKNSYHTDVIAIGQKSHKVIHHEHVTKEEERSSQKHELYGTKKMYEKLDEKGVSVYCHGHDRHSGEYIFSSLY